MPKTVVVEIRNFQLPAVTVRVGDSVTWVQKDGVYHTATSGSNGASDGGWGSPTMYLDDTFTYTFATPGVFQYTCRFHPSMNGMVTVTG